MPIDRFAGLVDVEEPRFDKQRQESLRQNLQAVSQTCYASTASVGAFYHRKAETAESILISEYEARDHWTPRADT